jgi:hypothetical protein
VWKTTGNKELAAKSSTLEVLKIRLLGERVSVLSCSSLKSKCKIG